MNLSRSIRTAVLTGLVVATFLSLATVALASSHREAPAIRLDPVADDTDFYLFVDPKDPNRVILIGNWIPMEEPAGGPNFSNFGENVRYEFKIDNNGDAVEDITYRFTFQRNVRNQGTFLYTVGEVSSLNDTDLNVYYTYNMDRVTGPSGVVQRIAGGLIEAPNNTGPASFPNYETVSNEAVYYLPGGEIVFAGPRADPFYIDLATIFDLLNIPGRTPAPFAGAGQNTLAGFNVHSIALSIPIDKLTRNGTIPTDSADANAIISGWVATYRPATRTFGAPGQPATVTGNFVQVSRLGNPLINEVVIPIGQKDKFNETEPKDDFANFGTYVLNSELAGLLNALFGVSVPPNPRTDLLVLVQGLAGVTMRPGEVVSDQLRLNVAIPPTAIASVNKLGVIGGDNAGFPNGRRVYDDIVDIELRVVAGVLVDGFNVAPNNTLSDLVEGPDQPFLQGFPYLATPHSGFDHKHDHPNDPRVCGIDGSLTTAAFAPDGSRIQ